MILSHSFLIEGPGPGKANTEEIGGHCEGLLLVHLLLLLLLFLLLVLVFTFF